MLLTLSVSAAWGATDTFTCSTPSNATSPITGTSENGYFTVSHSKAGASNWYTTSVNHWRVYEDATVTITPKAGVKITKIEMTVSSSSYPASRLGCPWEGEEEDPIVLTATAQCRPTKITVTYEEASKDPYTVTLDAGSGSVTETELTEASAGEGVTLPNPTPDCGDWTFAGWAEESVNPETTTKPTLIAAGNYKPTANITLYAVYQKTEGGGGSSTTTTFTFADIASAKNWSNGTAYTPVEISPITITANGGGNNAKYYTSDKTWRMYNGGSLEITTSTGSITNVSSNPSCTFTITNGMATCYFSETTKFKSITVTSGGGSTTYYHSTPECTTETSYSVTSTLSRVTAAGGNPTTVTSEDEDLTLTYLPEDGWNLPATISVTMGGNSLMLDNEYTWDKENGKVWIVPDNGFTGDIVVTINGWQQLATPQNLSSEVTATSATLTWDEVANAKSYLVTIVDGGDLSADVPNTQTSYTFNNLTPQTDYLWTVKAIGDKVNYTDSEESETGEFTTSPSTCTVTYDANGGEGTITDDKEYTNGETVTIVGNYGKLTKDGYAFTGWNTADDGSGTTYNARDEFVITTNTTLYAQWCEAYWKLVTDAAELENDTRIVIAAKDEAVALSTTQNTNNRGQVEITKKYNTIVLTDTVQIITLELGTIQNTFAFNTGNGYLYAAGANSSNYLRTQVENNIKGLWEIAINAGNTEIVVTPTANISHNILKHNSTSDCFSCYEEGNNQKAVVIYKEVCVQDLYNVNEPKLTNATADNNNPTTVAADATSLTLNYSANTGYLLPETITVKMGGALLVATTDYTWDKATGTLTINVTGFYGDIDVKIVAEEDPCYQFAMSEVTATSTTPNSITLTWNEVTGATGYNVRLGDDGFIAATGLTHTFTGLNPKTSYTWEVQAVKGTCQASQTGSITTQKETFTVSWVVNGNTTTTESVVDGESITQYPSDPSAPSGCHEKVFVGWTDNPINTPTNEAPAILYKQKSDVPAITDNTTLRAVWADVIGGGETTKSLLNTEIQTFHKQGTTTSYSDLTIPSTDGDWSGLFCTANSSSVYTINLKKDAVNDKRPYLKSSEYNSITKVSVVATHASTKGNRILYLCNAETDSPESNNIGTISVAKDNNTSQVCTLSSSATTLYLYVDNGLQIKTITLTTGGRTYSAYTTLCDECTPSTLTLEADNTTADLDKNGNATITFTTTGGNGGEITYAANPKTGVTWENGTATFTKADTYTITASQEKNGEYCPTTSNAVNVTITATPHLYFVTEPAPTTIVFDPVECGGNTPLANKKSVELQGYNLTGNVTATVTGAYKIARTSSATLGEYSTLLTLDKNNDGKINGNYDVVYILSCPPAGGTASTEGTLTFTTQGGEQLTVNLSTPTVTCTPRTLTFNDRGNITTQEYYAGAEVPQPEDPTGVCTIPVNYVFDGWAEAEVTDGFTSYTKVNFPYSMPAANTTLYAVYRYTEENANSDKFMSVNKELGELVSGMDYVLTGYYNGDDNEYAMSITAYETGKYKTKYVDVQESSILYEEDIPYYEFTTTDNEIIWTIEGDEANGYTFQNKSNNKYLAVSADKLTLSDNAAKFTIEHETGVIDGEDVYYMSLLIQPVGSTKYLSSYYKDGTAGVLFNLHTTSTLSLYLYKRVASNLYTTSPDCGGIAITYDFAGGDGGHCTDTRVEGGSDYTICEDVPTKTGYTFLHWSDGANTYNPSDVIEDVTADITLTAVWQINTYTVIWSNNGVTTLVTYKHGDYLTLPSAPASCDGVKEFVGWTEDNTFTYHATTPPSDLFTEKTATVTANATYYAVFATKGEGSANFVLGESGTFKMYANVNGTNYYAQGGVSSSKITSTTEAANASDYTLTHKGSNQYTIQLGNAYIGHSGTSSTDLNTTETTWTIKEGVNGSWRIVSPVNTSRALAYRASTYKIFKAYSMTSVEAGDTEYYDIEFGGVSSGYSDYTTTCQQIESIEVQSPKNEFYLTDDFTIGTGKVIATLSGGGTTDVTALATFSGYNMNVVGTYTVTVTYMGATATYEINVKPLDNAWVLTWNVSGKTNTGLGPRSVTKGSAIGTLPTPVVPDACEGKTFMGWTTSNIVNSDGTGITYITSETVPTNNTTYYAVFATVNNFCTQKPIDQITSGSKVVIVAVASLTADGGSGKAISSRATDDTYNLQGDSVAILEEHINTPHSTCIWTVTKEDGKYIFTQDGKYLNGAKVDSHYNLKYNDTKDTWTLTSVAGKDNTYHMKSSQTSYFAEFFKGKFTLYKEANDQGDFDMQFFMVAGSGADITDYTTGCTEYTITYYGFRGGYSTSTSSDGIIVLPVNSMHTVPNCGDVVTDHTNLGRTFTGVWKTQPDGGKEFKPGDTFILTQDTAFYAQWKLETTGDITLPTDVEDLAGTDIYVYGGKTLTLQPGTTNIHSLTLKGGIQSDGSYQMPNVWIPDGATLIRKKEILNLDLTVNAKNYYPFAVPFRTKNASSGNNEIDYLDPVLRAASTYGTHFVIKTYDGARRAEKGEDRDNNWVKVNRDKYLEAGVGYIITALTYPDKDTATIRIPMTVKNSWFENGEQTTVGSTTRNTITANAHTGTAASGHPRHAGWNFVASPYLSKFAGNNVANNGTYINGELLLNGGFEYGGEDVPYVTIPAYDFSYYEQYKISEVTLSPEWSFFVQIATDGTIDFAKEGRQPAPAGLAARAAEERPVKMDVDITLTDGNHSDQTGIIINDRYSDAYEIGRDLEKMFGSAYNLVVYSLMSDNTPLAYQALAELNHMQTIPIGYRAPQAGEYTFSLNQSTSSIDLLNEQYDQLILVDYETGALTNLLNSSYTFDSERTQSTSRFALYAIPRQNTPTDVPNFDSGDNNSTRKILHNGHLYIIRDGKVYNGHGQIVKH